MTYCVLCTNVSIKSNKSHRIADILKCTQKYVSGEKCQKFVAFSFYTNGKKLFSYISPESKSIIRCMDGMRVISMMWITFAHVEKFYISLPVRNKSNIERVRRNGFYSKIK